MKQIKLVFGLILLLAAPLLHAASLSSNVNRNAIGINETLTLLVTYSEQVSTNQLNLNALQNDFEVLSSRPQSSSNMSVINGQVTRQSSTTWTVLLAPRRVGRLVIPAFSLAGQTSNAISIQVSKANVVPVNDQPLHVTISVDKKSVFIAQQFIISVTLSANQSVRDLSGDPLTLDSAHIEQLEQQSFQRIENGIARQIVILKYAVFANEAGEINIPSQLFKGVVGARRSIFDSFSRQQPQQVIARSKTITVLVKPQPDGSSSPWFPSNKVTMQSTWSIDKKSARVGVPITRTINIVADQQRASVITPLTRPSQITYKTYSDQPQLENTNSAKGITGTRIESEAIVPSQSGELVLPEIRLNWWDTNNNQWQTTTLAAETLIVSPALVNAVDESTPGITTALPNSNLDQKRIDNNWKWAALFFAVLSLVLFLLIIKLKTQLNGSNKNGTTTTKLNKDKTETANWNRLYKSIKTNDIRLIRQDLITWAKSAFSDSTVTSIQMIVNSSERVLEDNTQLKTQLIALEQQLYNNKAKHEMSIEKLIESLVQLRKALNNKKSNTKPSSLAPLYPE